MERVLVNIPSIRCSSASYALAPTSLGRRLVCRPSGWKILSWRSREAVNNAIDHGFSARPPSWSR